uniref:Uncharacterized protein n=1 Tax=viral metagenome TaxID=1070528 RepID=A0A6C0DAF2_9ZZZZ
MSKQLLQNNIFYQQSKNKSNPDVLVKKSTTERSRNENIFKKNNVVYNSITNQTLTDIKTQKDLELSKDIPLSNIEKILADKAKERQDQEILCKPIKQKIVMENKSIESTQIFTDLKKDLNDYTNKQNIEIQTNKNKYENIMINLKNLGIIKN